MAKKSSIQKSQDTRSPLISRNLLNGWVSEVESHPDEFNEFNDFYGCSFSSAQGTPFIVSLWPRTILEFNKHREGQMRFAPTVFPTASINMQTPNRSTSPADYCRLRLHGHLRYSRNTAPHGLAPTSLPPFYEHEPDVPDRPS